MVWRESQWYRDDLIRRLEDQRKGPGPCISRPRCSVVATHRPSARLTYRAGRARGGSAVQTPLKIQLRRPRQLTPFNHSPTSYILSLPVRVQANGLPTAR